MKKTLLLIILFNMSISYLNAQVNPTERFITHSAHIPTNIERYKIDYEIVDQSLIESDMSILTELNLERIEHLRHETDDVMTVDKNTGIEIVIYSVQKVGIRKANALEFNHKK